MATYVYDSTLNSPEYQIINNVPLNLVGTVGAFWPTPEEYQPISLEVSENLDDMFVEPSIRATYFDMVQLSEGDQWPVTDYASRLLYIGRVASKNAIRGTGTVEYTFETLMSRLANHEPSGIVSSVMDLGLGPRAEPRQVLTRIMAIWNDDIPGLSLRGPVPDIVLRGTTGPITPFVRFITLQQTLEPRTILEFLEELFAPFEGFYYRMEGNQLNVIPPAWQQTSPDPILLTGSPVIAEQSSLNTARIVNSQKVSHAPMVPTGNFSLNTDGTPKIPNDLPIIGVPTYYRMGVTDLIPPPKDREFREMYGFTPIVYSDEGFPIGTKIRITWNGFVFAVASAEGATGYIEATPEMIVRKVWTIDLEPGESVDLATQFLDRGGSARFVVNVLYKDDASGVVIIPIHGLEVQPFQPDPSFVFAAEFHLDIQGQAYVKHTETFSATYGVYTPPTLPMGAKEPPFELASDAETDASRLLYGRRAGQELQINIWNFVTDGRTDEEIILALVRGERVETLQEGIVRILMDIAQNTVKERIKPYKLLTLTLIRPFVLTTRDLGRLVNYFEQVGIMSSYEYSEAHSMTASDVTATIQLKIPQEDDGTAVEYTFTPPAADAPVLITPPGNYPPGGEYPPPLPPEPITATGMAVIELGERFDLLRVVGTAATRIRLYRTEASRTADASRAVEVFPEGQPEEDLILEAVLTADNLELDLHAILGHTEEGVVYANIEAGTVTFYLFIPDGSER